jgi:hypothetical protein
LYAGSDVVIPPSNLQILLTPHEVKQQMLRLGNKAVGVDELKDTQLKLASSDDKIVEKVTLTFNKWLNGDLKIPGYCTTARIIPLSK